MLEIPNNMINVGFFYKFFINLNLSQDKANYMENQENVAKYNWSGERNIKQ